MFSESFHLIEITKKDCGPYILIGLGIMMGERKSKKVELLLRESVLWESGCEKQCS
jgi:hypothetical protein